MKLTLDKKHGNRIEFLADGVPLTFANMLRRHAMSMLPVLAVDTVVFYDNTSAFWDEYLAHRLGLMPVLTPEDLPEGAEVTFSLDAQGPATVRSGDLKSTDKQIKFAIDNIPLLTLGSNQVVRLEGKAILGTAKTHAKFQAGIMSYGEEEKHLRMMVESFYQMEPYEVVKRALDIIENSIETAEAALGEAPAKKKPAAKKAAKKTTAKKTTKKKTKKDESEE